MRSPRILAVDIGAGHVACGVFSTGATGRLVLQQFALEPHSSDPSHEARWAVEIAQSLGAIAARTKLGGPASITVPGHLALLKFVKTPSVGPEKRRKIVEFEAAENIPHPLNEVVWDHVVVADDGFDLEVILGAVKFEAMQALCTASDAAGFPVERALPVGLALHHAFRYSDPDFADGALVVNIGARTTNLLFADRLQVPDYGGYSKHGGKPNNARGDDRFYVRTLPLGGNAVTQAIAEELRIDFGQAETLKVQVLSGKSDLPAGSPSRAAVQRAAATFCARLGLEITRSTVNHRRQSGAAAPTAVFITGGGSLIPELPEVLGEKLRLRVERFRPLKRVDVAADARAAGAESAEHVLTDLVGLATGLVVKGEPETSLLPPSITNAIAFRKRQPLLIAAAAIAAAALLPPIYYYQRKVEVLMNQIELIDGELMPLRSVQTRNEENIQKITEAKKQIEALRGAYETKSNWINFFADLQDRLVKNEDVWLERVAVTRVPVSPEVAAAAAAAAAAAPAPENAANPNPTEPPPAPPAPKAELKLTLTGRLLDVANPQSKVSPESFERVKQLLASFKGSQFVALVENERFDPSQNGLLRFDVTLVIKPGKSL